MKYLFQIYQVKILTAIIVIILFAWNLWSAIVLLTQKKEVLLIEISSSGARVIDKTDENTEKYLQEAFLIRFVGLSYNFTNLTYERNISKAGDLMSENMWENKITDIERIKKELLNKPYTQSAVITGVIKKIKDNEFEIPVDITLNKEAQDFTETFKMVIETKKITRNSANPWGWEVTNVKELRD